MSTIFEKEELNCWVAPLPAAWDSDTVDSPRQSILEFFEDEKAIGPPHALHDEIRQLGGGRYSHWGGALFFSTSDNSDPNTNAKTFSVRHGDTVETLKRGECWPIMLPAPPRKIDSPLYQDYLSVLQQGPAAQAPVNLQQRSPEEIKAAAEYALQTAAVASVLRGAGASLEGVLLELGPGSEFGGTLILGEKSRRLIVADRFLSRWQEDFHLPLYQEVQRMLCRSSRILDEVVRQRGYDGLIEQLEEPAWDLKSIENGSVDLVYSNAVLEHVHPLPDAARELYRVTAKGGYGIHQVDFRYHRSLDRPLEHLLFTREEFEELTEFTHAEVGTQWRVKEVVNFFRQAGFEITRVDVQMTATDSYMRSFLPRLRASQASPYKDWAEADLAGIGARIFARKD